MTPSEDDPPEPLAVLGAGVVVYGAMVIAALAWLLLRDRLEAVGEASIGIHGPFAASAVGLAVGLAGARLLDLAVRRDRRFEELTSAAQRLFVRSGEWTGIAFALLSAFAEELFFRLAVQDVFGLLGSVAAYVLLNSRVGGLRWITFTLLHALVLGLLVQRGFGLLGSTSAHAILNYLCLRKLQNR